ncbi:MAG: hypothetical protein J7K45_01180 [Thaumarchaeota archaeon]|nr:hypothetical protein [Nitrososphaerota archaeon]
MKPYVELLERLERMDGRDHGRDLIEFDQNVLRRYREGGPWRLLKDGLVLYGWHEEEPVRMLSLKFFHEKGKVKMGLRDLASMPKSEQLHWRKFQLTTV